MRTRRARRLAASAAGCALLAAGGAGAHLLVMRQDLPALLAASDLVAVARIERPLGVDPESGRRTPRESYRVRLLRPLAGSLPEERELDVLPHDAAPAYRPGDRAVLFLQRVAGSRNPGRFTYLLVQDAGHPFVLEPAWAEEVEAHIRAVAAAAARGLPSAAHRELLLAGLRARAPVLRRDALAQLLVPDLRARLFPPGAEGSRAAAPFLETVDAPDLPVAQRAILLALLAEHAGGGTGARFRALERAARDPADLRALAQAAGVLREPAATSWLAACVRRPESGALRMRCAAALGRPWHRAAVPELARVGRDGEPALARAAVRALGGMGGPEAEAALRELARARGPGRRGQIARLAQLELRRLARSRHLADAAADTPPPDGPLPGQPDRRSRRTP